MEEDEVAAMDVPAILSNADRLAAFLRTGADPGAADPALGASYAAAPNLGLPRGQGGHGQAVHPAAAGRKQGRGAVAPDRRDDPDPALYRRHTALDDVIPALIAGGEGDRMLRIISEAARHGHAERRRCHLLYVLAKILSVRVKGTKVSLCAPCQFVQQSNSI